MRKMSFKAACLVVAAFGLIGMYAGCARHMTAETIICGIVTAVLLIMSLNKEGETK